VNAAQALVKASFYPLMGYNVQIERIIAKKKSEPGKVNVSETSPKHLAAKL
jgi:hypothetical protein